VRARYDGIAWAVGATLDGGWSYEDTRAAYVPVGRPENRHQGAEVGAFLLEDILHWVLARKQPDRQALIVVDDDPAFGPWGRSRSMAGVASTG